MSQEERARGSINTCLLLSVATKPLPLTPGKRCSLFSSVKLGGIRHRSIHRLPELGTSRYETKHFKAPGVLICELDCYSGLIS